MIQRADKRTDSGFKRAIITHSYVKGFFLKIILFKQGGEKNIIKIIKMT